MAKRVNTRFLIGLTIVVGVLIAVAVTAAIVFNQKDPEKYVALAEQEIEKKNYGDALNYLHQALQADPNNPAIMTRFGDVFDMVAGEDPENLMKARAYWGQAVSIDPRHAPALERILDSFWDEAEFSPYGRRLVEIIEVADKLGRADPGNAKAVERKHIATVRAAQMGEPIKSKDLEASSTALSEMAKKDPANADLPRWIALSKVLRASEMARKATRLDETRQLLAEGAAVFDKAVVGQENNAAMQLRAYEVYAACEDISKITEESDEEEEDAAAPAKPEDAPKATADAEEGADDAEGEADKPVIRDSKAYAVLAGKSIEAASAAVKADDPLYVDVQVSAAQHAARHKRLDEAKKIIADLVAQKSDDIRVRLVYARAASTGLGDRAKAIALLDQPVDEASTGLTGAKALLIRGLRFQAYYELTNARLIEYANAKDAATRKALSDKAEEDFKKFENLAPSPDHPLVYKLRGKKLEFSIRGGNLDLDGAIQAYEKALARWGAQKDTEVVFSLARLYLRANQAGLAKNLLNANAERLKGLPYVHELMAAALLTENDLEGAEEQIELLEKANPQSTAIAGLREGLKRLKDPDAAEAEIEEKVAKLPEKTREEKLLKGASSFNLKNYAEAVRLGEAVLKEDPKDLNGIRLLISAHMAEDRKADARRVLAEARKQLPDNKDLELAEGQLAEGANPASVRKLEEQYAAGEKNEFLRAVRLSDIARRYGDLAGATKHLGAAEAKQPPGDNGAAQAVAVRRFSLALVQRRWNDAVTLIEKKLSRGDAMDGWGYRHELAATQGDWPAAEKAAREMVKRRGNYAQNHAALAVALQRQGKLRDALNAFEAALDAQPRNKTALQGNIECYFALNDVSSTKAAIDAARKLYPEDRSFRETALNYELQHGDVEVAIKAREELFDEDPKNADVVLALAQTYVQAVRTTYDARADKKAELLGKAREVLKDGMAQWKDDARFHATMADSHLVGGDFKAGQQLLLDYATRPNAADSARPFLMLADYYGRANKLNLAETSLIAALKKFPKGTSGEIELRLRLSNVLSGQKKYEAALAALADIPNLARQRVQILARAGRLEDAEKEMKVLLAGRETTPEAMTDLAGFYIDTNQYDKALKAVNDLLTRHKGSDVGLYYRGLLRMKLQPPDLNGAIEDLSTVTQRNPRHAEALKLLADAYLESHKPINAVQTLREAIGLLPTNRELRAKLVELQLNSYQWGDVIEVAEEARKRPTMANEPTWPRAVAMAHSAQGRHGPAEKEIRIALSLVAANDRDRITRDLLDILMKAGKFDGVVKETDAIIKAAGITSAPWWAYYNRGLALNALEKKPQAIAELDEALKRLNPMDDIDRDNAGRVARSIGQVAGDAREALKRVEPWAKDDLGWKLASAQLHLRARNMDKVIELCEYVLAQEPTGKLTPVMLSESYRTLGDAYQQANPPQFEKAIATYEKMVEKFPQDVIALNNLAYLLAEEVSPPQPMKAKVYSGKAYDIVKYWNPVDVLVVDTHGWILVQTGDKEDLEDGIAFLREVVADRPKLLEARYHLGEAYLKYNLPQDAEKELVVAASLLDEARRQKMLFDPRLGARIKQARDRAQEMMRAAADGGAAAR